MPKLMSKRTFRQIEELLQTHLPHKTIGLYVGVNSSAVGRIAQGKHFYQQSEEEKDRRQNLTHGQRRGDRPGYMPTPEEIKFECERIQRRRRREMRRCKTSEDDRDDWMPQVYSVHRLVASSR